MISKDQFLWNIFSNACNYHAINGTQLPIAQREDDGSSASIHFILQSNCL